MDILQRLREDYQRFPHDQSYDLYAEDVYFKDPMTEFRGIAQYQQMIGTIARFFQALQLELHDIQLASLPTSLPTSPPAGQQIRTDWTLSWTTPLPWRPRITISGWSELQLNEAGLISSHIDYWHCSKWDVLRQHWGKSSKLAA